MNWSNPYDPRARGHSAAVVLGAVLLVMVVHPAASGGARGLARAHGLAGAARWALTAPMRADRDKGTATLLKDGRVLVTGGYSPRVDPPLASAELYDPRTGRWAMTGSLRYGRAGAAAVLLPDGRVLVAGGGLSDERGDRTAELYDPRSGHWQSTVPMARAIRPARTAAAVLRDGTALVVGGGGAQLYDPRSGRWTSLATRGLIWPKAVEAVALRDGRVLVVNGHGNGVAPDAVVYDPRARRWTATGPMPPGSSLFAEALAPVGDGRVLAVGGFTDLQAHGPAGVALYDPRTNRWARGSSPRRRFEPLAAAMPDGRVLLVGGTTDAADFNPVTTCDLYDGRTGRWTPTTALHTPRASAAGALMTDGRYLVAGGTYEQDLLENADPRAAEIFTP